jgi:hypothetical protein
MAGVVSFGRCLVAHELILSSTVRWPNRACKPKFGNVLALFRSCLSSPMESVVTGGTVLV